MKNRLGKRIIATVMCLGMLLSMVPMISISAAYDYTTVIEKTTALNIIPEQINGEDFVTRKELAKFIYYMINVSENGGVYSTEQYYDVDKTDDYYEYISVISGFGIMVGVSEASFAPDMNTTFGQVARVLLNATGYYQLAREGTMESYSKVAASLGILDDVAYDPNSEILMGELAQMIWNAMQLNAVESTISGKSKQIVTDRTLLWHYHKIAESDGKVTANEDTAVDNNEGVGEGCVKVDGTIFKAGTDYVKDMLGRDIRFYYKVHENYDEPIIMWAELIDDKGYVFDATEIKDVVVNSSDITFSTEVNGKEKDYKLSLVVDVIFNGKHRAFDTRDLKPLIGNVELVDADGDRVFELAIVKSYAPYVVKSVDAEASTIYEKRGLLPITFDEEARVKIKKDGAIIALEEIEEENIALVAADKTSYDVNNVMSVDSANSMIYDIIVSNNVVVGQASAVSLDEKTAVIDGVTYDIRATIDPTGTTNVKLGEDATYYIDAFSNIVYVKIGTVSADANTAVGGGTYGFVTNIKYKTFDDTVTMRIFDINGQWGTYTLAEKVRIDRVTHKKAPRAAFEALTAEDIEGRLLTDVEPNANTSIYAYAIVYKLNDEGEISYIDTPKQNSGENEDNSLFINEDEYDTNPNVEHNGDLGYVYMGTWDDKYCIPTTLMGITIPFSFEDSTVKVLTGEDYERNYSVKRMDSTRRPKLFQLFNSGEERTPKFAVDGEVFSLAGRNLDNTYANYIITKKIETVNEDNEEVTRLAITGPGGTKTIDISPETMVRSEEEGSTTLEVITVADLDKGDIIAYSANGADIILVVRRFDAIDDDSGNFNERYAFDYRGSSQLNSTESLDAVWGKVHMTSGNFVQVYLADDHTDLGVYDLQGKALYCYDMAENTFTEMGINQLRAYMNIGQLDENADRIFIVRRRERGVDVFVYRNVPTA